MKVKFYKGPWHGKTKDISESDYRRGIIEVVGMDKRATARTISNAPNHQIFLNAGFRTAAYKVVMMSAPGAKEPFPAVHPDGSVFFKYDGSR